MHTSTEGKVEIFNRSGFKGTAFTLIELLVVLATITLFAAMLLPALAGTQVQSKTTGCMARYRQWALSANLYANDHQGWLPSFDPYGGGAYAWDVGTNMINALYPYGMDVPVWFCPMRPAEWDRANQLGQSQFGHPVQNGAELTWVLGAAFGYPGECQIKDNYWVPRYDSTSHLASNLFPQDFSGKPKAIWPAWLVNQPTIPTSAIYGWPQRLHDAAVPYVPFVSDLAGIGSNGGLVSPPLAPPVVTNISPNTAHFVNGTLIGVNLAFADGHVASHTPDQMRVVYRNLPTGNTYWLY